jgi:hypothetical protein
MCMKASDLLSWYQHYFDTLEKPKSCSRCGNEHIAWDGSDVRTAELWVETGDGNGEVIHVDDIPIRRACCGKCGHHWRLLPPGLMPRRRIQLCVVAKGLQRLLAGDTLAKVAELCDCSLSTVRRWIRWVAAVADPADLMARLVEVVGAPVVVETPEVSPRISSRPTWLRAARVFFGFEALATALRMEPPGLRAVVCAVLGNRDGHTTYARPSIPEFGIRRFGGQMGIFVM